MKTKAPLWILLVSLNTFIFSCEEKPEVEIEPLIACINPVEEEMLMGKSYQFTSCSEGDLSFQWVIAGPAVQDTLADKAIDYVFKLAGTYKISLQVREKSGRTSAVETLEAVAMDRSLTDITTDYNDIYFKVKGIESDDGKSFVLVGAVDRGAEGAKNFFLKVDAGLSKVVSNDFVNIDVAPTNICKADFGYLAINFTKTSENAWVHKVGEDGQLIEWFNLPKSWWTNSFVAIAAIGTPNGFLILGEQSDKNILTYKLNSVGDLEANQLFRLEGREDSELKLVSDFESGPDDLTSVVFIGDVTRNQLLKVTVSNSSMNVESVVDLGPLLNGYVRDFFINGDNVLMHWSAGPFESYLFNYKDNVLSWEYEKSGENQLVAMDGDYYLVGRGYQIVKLNNSGSIVWERDFSSGTGLQAVSHMDGSLYLFGFKSDESFSNQQITGLILNQADLE